MNSILENIDTIRRNKGYSQEYLAMQIGMKQAGFSLIMSGERELKYNTLLQIAKALQMPVIDVITFPDKYVVAKGHGTATEAVLIIILNTKLPLHLFLRQEYILLNLWTILLMLPRSLIIFIMIQAIFTRSQAVTDITLLCRDAAAHL